MLHLLTLNQCTVYIRNQDGTYARQTSVCHWQDKRGIQYSGGYNTTLTDNLVYVMIPLNNMELPIVSAKGKTRNYIVKGIVEDEVNSTNVEQTMQTLNGLTIKAIDKNDYSIGLATNHWAVHAV